MKPLIFSTLFFVLLLGSCNTATNKKTETYIPADTTTSFKVYGYWLTPKPEFNFDGLGILSTDTIELVNHSAYVYAPFGQIKNEADLKTSPLKNFTIIYNKLDTFSNPDVCKYLLFNQTLKLQWGKNMLDLFLDNDPYASTHGYINGGEVNDSLVSFANSIKVGMGIDDFCKTFFIYFPEQLQSQFKVIVFHPTVEDTKHMYTFTNKKLNSVKFVF